MNILGRYVHGSSNSLDVDIHYIVDELPSLANCNRFCNEDPDENRNLIVIKDGVVTDCYKGSPDEVNNGILATYCLHEQDTQLWITRKLQRNIPIKVVRSIRGIISHLSRSQYRNYIKTALRGDWMTRIECLANIDLSEIDFDSLLHNMSGADIKKFIAFQVGQCLGLFDGHEYFTKLEMGFEMPELAPYLDRQECTLDNLQMMLNKFLFICRNIVVEYYGSTATFNTPDGDTMTIDLISEKIL